MSNSVSNPGKFPGGITPENNRKYVTLAKHLFHTFHNLQHNPPRKAQS